MNILIWKTVKIRSYEAGLLFRDGEFRGLLAEGRHWFLDLLGKVAVQVVSKRDPWLVHEKLDVIVKSGALQDRAVVLDLKDYQRALVWIDGRFSHVLPPGLYAYGARACPTVTKCVQRIPCSHWRGPFAGPFSLGFATEFRRGVQTCVAVSLPGRVTSHFAGPLLSARRVSYALAYPNQAV